MSYASYFILCLFFSYACCHLCIISPRQRGPIDISKSGSHTCFRHGAPCGGQAEESPRVNYPGGQPVFIKWQQNYNHYEPGYPGYMDIAVARADDLGNFQLLAFVQDEYVYRQDYQRNYTAVVVLPNLDCSHCVIRARYNAHKPGETIFYQCSDISITRTASPVSGLPSMQSPPNEPEYRHINKALILHQTSPMTSHMSLPSVGQTFKIYGVVYDPYHNNASYYAQIDPTTGYFGALNFYDAGLGSGNHISTNLVSRVHLKGSAIEEERRFLLDAVFAMDDTSGTTTYLFHSGSLDNLASQMWIVNTETGRRQRTVDLAISMPINSLHSDGAGNYVAFQIVNSEKGGFFEFRIDRIDSAGNVVNILETSSPENTFINFQWAHYDIADNMLYVLLGDENGADKLDARFYVFDLNVRILVSKADIDVSKYTFQSFQYYSPTKTFFALSPGLFTSNNVTWTLVHVFPKTGAVVKAADIGGPGIFQKYYGGTVHNGIDQQNGILTHVFRIAESGADIIAYIDINNDFVTYSQLNNIRSIHNLAIHYS